MNGRPLTSVASTPVDSTTARIAYRITRLFGDEIDVLGMEFVAFNVRRSTCFVQLV